MKPQLYRLLIISFVLLLIPTAAHAASQMRITELMYDPVGTGGNEFIEIHNGSTQTADLSGWRFQGVTFTIARGTTIAPGGYAVVVRNLSAFRASHPSARVLGQYAGKLVGRGEAVGLIDSSGAVVSQVSYSPVSPWPTSPRNGGPSLSLIRVTANEATPQCWAPSAYNGGTPGAANSLDSGWVNSNGGGCGNKAYWTAPAETATPSASATAQAKQQAAQQAAAAQAKKEVEQKAAAAAVAEKQKQEELKKSQASVTTQPPNTSPENSFNQRILAAILFVDIVIVACCALLYERYRWRLKLRKYNKRAKKAQHA